MTAYHDQLLAVAEVTLVVVSDSCLEQRVTEEMKHAATELNHPMIYKWEHPRMISRHHDEPPRVVMETDHIWELTSMLNYWA